MITIDGSEAAARIAYKTSEVIAIYPITPSSGMGELADAWAAAKKPNLWGTVPVVQQMQSEGGAAGAVHGSLQTGSLTTTFTASQGLLLMIPNMFKIAGELTPTVFHIAARSIATGALSIFGDHSDVMSVRSCGWAMLFANSVQEVHDFALISQAATLKSRIPFLHIFDGFRTSHEVAKIVPISDDEIRSMLDEDLIRAHRERALTPDHPSIRGTAQNPDVYFQTRESVNPYYNAVTQIVEETMAQFGEITGRRYKPFEYFGDPNAERVIVIMGSGAETVHETVNSLNLTGDKLGVLVVRLYRPFSAEHFVNALPSTVKAIAVLDRTKEPGGAGEPLYQDVLTAITEGFSAGSTSFSQLPRIVGGRYGLSSKEFTPAMVKAIFDELRSQRPKNHFTVGIIDDVTHTSLDYEPEFSIEAPDVKRAIFFGLGSDGTVGANKNSIKIIGEDTPLYAQGYFVYDSKKSGAVTISHLRFGPRPIKSPYLITQADFIAIHQFPLLSRYRTLEAAMPGATVLINSPYSHEHIWDELPRNVQEDIVAKRLRLFVIDALTVAKAAHMGVRINTIMQTAFFALSGILSKDEAIGHIKNAIEKTYGKRGPEVVKRNFEAVDHALAHLHEVDVPALITSNEGMRAPVPANVPEFVKKVTGEIIAGRGDQLPVSLLPVDGTFPSGTAQYEKRDIGTDLPIWDPDLCIQCGKCVMVCPHAVIRAKIAKADQLADAPAGIKSAAPKWRNSDDARYIIQVSHEDCTGCSLCADVCPAKDKQNPEHKSLDMLPAPKVTDEDRQAWQFFLDLPDVPQIGEQIKYNSVKNIQLLRPLFEFSGACSGCGETPYLKLLSQLFGDHTIIANATGCSSIYGGNLPTTPWSVNKEGRGPAWANSLFEDNAEFGLGMRLALNAQRDRAVQLLDQLAPELGEELVSMAKTPATEETGGLDGKRERMLELKAKLRTLDSAPAFRLLEVADALVEKSVWIVGGDGWAYDIGFGGLDHVLSTGENVNILVLDTEVYSNTGGQASKSTARGAVAKFATGGKPRPKKDLGMMAMSYGNVYVAQVALGGSDAQVIKAFLEAEAYPGPSLIIAYGHCIAHGIDMANGLRQQKMAVDSGYWPLFRFNPDRADQGLARMQLDSKAPALSLRDYLMTETRYRQLHQADAEAAEELFKMAQKDVLERWATYEKMASKPVESSV